MDKRAGDVTFANHGKSGKQNFGEACEQSIARMRVGENSRATYVAAYRTYGLRVFGDRALAQVARDPRRCLARACRLASVASGLSLVVTVRLTRARRRAFQHARPRGRARRH